MAAERGTPKSRRSLRTTRLEAFSDDVFAIAGTLLILDVVVHPPGSPLEQLLHAWPSYLAYVVSFLTIGTAWIVHTAVTDRLDHANSLFLRLNLILLMAVAFLPFPTRLLAEGLGERAAERVAATLYGLTLVAIGLAGSALDTYARREGLCAWRGEEGEEELQDSRRKSLIVILGYAVAILVGLVLPGSDVAFYVGLALFLVIPLQAIPRRRRGAS